MTYVKAKSSANRDVIVSSANWKSIGDIDPAGLKTTTMLSTTTHEVVVDVDLDQTDVVGVESSRDESED
jgi:hypothetical protein